ncbi:hypothetical protein AcW2_000459 [Taiwanofungus camphoratus]|nr:hypothetical protein AcW2_000459 [Antrodia cinnamomea]
MFDELIQQLSLRQPAVSAKFINLRDDGVVYDNFGTFKPNFAYGTVNSDDFRPNWVWLGVVGEVKKVMLTHDHLTNVRIDTRVLERNSSKASKRKRPRDDAHADEESSKKHRRVSEGAGDEIP